MRTLATFIFTPTVKAFCELTIIMLIANLAVAAINWRMPTDGEVAVVLAAYAILRVIEQGRKES